MNNSGNTLLCSAQVRARFGQISSMTLWRWVKHGTLPKPLSIHRRNFWRESDIDALQGSLDAAPKSQ